MTAAAAETVQALMREAGGEQEEEGERGEWLWWGQNAA